MASVTLNHPRSYMIGGFTYYKGVSQVVDDELGQHLKESGHFTVIFAKDIETQVSKFSPAKAPENPRQVYADIKLAMTKLDPNNNAHYTAEGKPQTKALTELLGYTVSAKTRDEALEAQAQMSDPEGKLKKVEFVDPTKPEKVETVEEVKGTGGVKITITKRVKKTNLPAEAAPTEEDDETDDGSAIDTGEGLEV